MTSAQIAPEDIGAVARAAEASRALVVALQSVHRSSNPLLVELAYSLLDEAAALRNRLDRLEQLAQNPSKGDSTP